mgnify:CR=1 FL=1
MIPCKTQFVIQTGDLVDVGDNNGQWTSYRDAVEGAAFALVILPFFLPPADWTIRAFGAIGRVRPGRHGG